MSEKTYIMHPSGELREAKAEIERLKAENERLEADARLGKLVRRMDIGGRLSFRVRWGKPLWRYASEYGQWTAETPEAALKAAGIEEE